MSTEAKVTKVRKLVDCFVVVEPDLIPYDTQKDDRKRIEYLESWAKELVVFLRDHGQSVKSVSVRRAYETVCSGCGHEWEEDNCDTDVPRCAYCGFPIEHVT
jgi:DNA-directed RNA polymerase subunit RPC12/RpoP